MNRVPPATSESRLQVRGSFLLVAGRLVSLLLNLLAQVLAIRYLIQADYGAFAFALSVMELVGYVSTLGLNKAAARFLPLYHEQGDQARALGMLAMSVATVLGVSSAIVLSLFAGRELLAEYLVSSELSLLLLLILLALAPIEALDFLLESFFGAFGEVRVVFFRRHVLRPGLKLGAVLAVILSQASVQTLAFSYLLAGVVGFVYYVPALVRVLRQQNLWTRTRACAVRFPVAEVWSYSGPLLSSHLVFLCQGSVAILLLEALSGSIAVGEFRAVLPFARLNVLVLTCFALLFTPLGARLLARNDAGRLDDLYWKSAAWITVLTFPIVAATTVFAPLVTARLLGEEYASASLPMTLLALGFYVEAVVGLSGQVLRIYARVRHIVCADVLATVTSVLLLLLFIPRFGAVGAAVGTAAFIVVAHIGYVCFSHLVTPVKTAGPRGLQVYAWPLFVVLGLLGFERLLRPHWAASALLVALAWFSLVIANRRALDVAQVCPEVARFPGAGRLFGSVDAVGAVNNLPPNDATEVA